MSAKFTTTSFSDVQHYQRMDAGFFVALDTVRDAYQKLCQEMTREQALERLRQLRLSDLRPVGVLARSNAKTYSETSLRAACREYPRLALAVTAKHLGKSIESIKDRIANDQTYLDELLKLREDVFSS